MSYIEKFKKIEDELEDILVKMRGNDSSKINMLLYSKAYLLSKKYAIVSREFNIKFNEFLSDYIDIKKKAIILTILNLIVLFMNLGIPLTLVLSLLCVGYNTYYISDILKNKNNIDETIIFMQSSYCNMISKMEECKSIITQQLNSEKVKVVNLLDYEYCVDIIMNYVYDSNYKLDDLSENNKNLIIKILQNDLNIEESDLNKLLSMYKDKVMEYTILKLELTKK